MSATTTNKTVVPGSNSGSSKPRIVIDLSGVTPTISHVTWEGTSREPTTKQGSSATKQGSSRQISSRESTTKQGSSTLPTSSGLPSSQRGASSTQIIPARTTTRPYLDPFQNHVDPKTDRFVQRKLNLTLWLYATSPLAVNNSDGTNDIENRNIYAAQIGGDVWYCRIFLHDLSAKGKA